MYCIAKVPTEPESATKVAQAFFDLYAYERGWKVLKSYEADYDEFQGALREDLFVAATDAAVDALLRQRRFVVLQGPPGTGKTRLAEDVQKKVFRRARQNYLPAPSRCNLRRLHRWSSDPKEGILRFDVRPGWLLEAAQAAKDSPFVLVIDEINRADLGKVLGEAIYLFEADEVGGERAETSRTPSCG